MIIIIQIFVMYCCSQLYALLWQAILLFIMQNRYLIYYIRYLILSDILYEISYINKIYYIAYQISYILYKISYVAYKISYIAYKISCILY